MTDAYPGEDERVHLMIAKDECAHEHIAPVCVRCGEPLPAPHPGYEYGVHWDTQEWSDWTP